MEQTFPANIRKIIAHVDDIYLPMHPDGVNSMLLKWQKWYEPLRQMVEKVRQGKKIPFKLIYAHKEQMYDYCCYFVNPSESIDLDEMMISLVHYAALHGDYEESEMFPGQLEAITAPTDYKIYITDHLLIRGKIECKKMLATRV
jgi:hypothetical protein